MSPNIPLLINEVSYILFFLITTIFGIWVYLKSSRKTSHVMFLLMSLAIGLYQISFAIGTGTSDSEASRIIFQLSLSIIFIVAFTTHWIATTIEREKEYIHSIVAMYTVGLALLAVYMLEPASFLLTSVPKLYFPNYYQAGSLYWLLIIYFILGFVFVMRMLFRAYKMADSTQKNRLMYYMTAILIGFPLGGTSFFLAYNIPFDPIFSLPFNFFIVPLAYGILRYDIMDIKIAARKTLAYMVFVLGTALFIFGANAGGGILDAVYPNFPDWIIPLASSLIIVLFAGYMWERMRDLEALKYEFITVVTHKFRTPLTRIKWAAEIIKHQIEPNTPANSDQKLALGEIEDANEHLVVLTDMLVDLRKANESAYLYEFKTLDVCAVLEKALRNMKKHINDKKIDLKLSCAPNVIFVNLDPRRMLFALQIIIENAVTYTPENGKIEIALSSDGSDAYINVIDSGMGIEKSDLQRIFSKFWRSKEAKVTDTEGLGIGLFMAKDIIDRHGGGIYVRSEGLGKGSKFTIKLPHQGFLLSTH